MASPIHCRLEVDAYGTPPRRIRIEAQACEPGFSVWYFDDHRCPDGEQIGRSDRAYDAREFAQMNVGNRLEVRARYIDGERWLPPVEWNDVRVTGERGFRAHLLRRTLSVWPCDWALQQSDASCDAVDAAFGEAIDDEVWKLLIRIVVRGDDDLFALLSRHGVPATSAAMREFGDELKRRHDRPLLEQEARRQASLAPFRREIEVTAAKFNDEPTRGAGMVWPSLRRRMTMFLEQYVLKHGRMPQGKVDGEYELIGARSNMGPLDFDEIRKQPPWPERPRDSAQSPRDEAP